MSDPQHVAVTYTLSREDLWQFTRYFQFRFYRQTWWKLALFILIYLGLAACLISYLIPINLFCLLKLFITWLPPLLLFIAVMLFLVLKLQEVNVKRFPAQNSLVFDETTLTLTPEEYQSTSETTQQKIPWRRIHDITETRDYLFIFLDKSNVKIVPKKTFPSPEAAAEFCETANNFFQKSRS